MVVFILFLFFFFFKQKTAYEMRISDWSSDVCSSDLLDVEVADRAVGQPGDRLGSDRRAQLLDQEGDVAGPAVHQAAGHDVPVTVVEHEGRNRLPQHPRGDAEHKRTPAPGLRPEPLEPAGGVEPGGT